MIKNYYAIDLFAGCGGLSKGMIDAGFNVLAAVEIDKNASKAYLMNHKSTTLIEKDIRAVNIVEFKKILGNKKIHLLAGCPPCQGFSTVRRLNKKANFKDKRNDLIMEYLRFIKEIRPLTIMMENVPGLMNYYLFKKMLKELDILGYNPKCSIVNVKNYGVPQTRKRLVMVGSIFNGLDIAPGNNIKLTVRDAIENLKIKNDKLNNIKAGHSSRIQKMISLIPKNGGSRKDLPKKYKLNCHKKKGIGFNDIYGRLRWDDFSTTITGGCLNPSKGRFLHPSRNRSLTAREAALLQSFPLNYKFPLNISKSSLALLIGNALPPKFSFIQSKNIKEHLDLNL